MGALIMLPILGAAGVAVDYSRVANVRSGLQNAADAAALAVVQDVEELSNRQIRRQVRRFFNANSDATIKFARNVRTRGRVRESSLVVTAVSRVDTLIMHALGTDRVRVRVESEAFFAQNPVEMALVIDNTRSMDYGGSWNTVADAIGDTLDTIDSRTTSGSFHVTLVPYTDRVNVSDDREDWLGYRPGDPGFGNGPIDDDDLDDWEGCLEPREVAQNGLPFAVDLTAQPGEFLPTAPAFWSGSSARGTSISECAEPIFGPSTDISEAKNELRDLEPKNATGRFDDALAWGWRAISPDWMGKWGAGANYPSDRPNRDKIVAMFTDGRTNINRYEMERANGEFGNNNGSISVFNHFLSVCDEIKDQGARVFIFDTGANSHAESYFRNCAEDDYFKVENQAALMAAIKSLGDDVVKPRLVK